MLSDVLIFLLAIEFCELVYPGTPITIEQGVLSVVLIAVFEIVRHELINKLRGTRV